MELALLTRWLSTTLNHGTNGWKLEIFELEDLSMPPSLLDLSSCPAYQVEVLTDKMMIIVTHLILTVAHDCRQDQRWRHQCQAFLRLLDQPSLPSVP